MLIAEAHGLAGEPQAGQAAQALDLAAARRPPGAPADHLLDAVLAYLRLRPALGGAFT